MSEIKIKGLEGNGLRVHIKTILKNRQFFIINDKHVWTHNFGVVSRVSQHDSEGEISIIWNNFKLFQFEIKFK